MELAQESRLKSETQDSIVLLAPMTGLVVPLADVPDPVFADGMLGDGIGIDPLEGKLVAPCEGVVTHLARTGHALTLQTAQGAEILLHIGIDTVDLNGQGFAAKVAQGARVKAGDILIEFDQDFVATKAPSLISIVAVANTDVFEIVERPGETRRYSCCARKPRCRARRRLARRRRPCTRPTSRKHRAKSRWRSRAGSMRVLRRVRARPHAASMPGSKSAMARGARA